MICLLKEQQATAENVRLRRVSHQSVVLKPKAQFDHMLETLAWERDIDLSIPKVLSASNQNLNLTSTQNLNDIINPGNSHSSSPPPPQFITNQYPTKDLLLDFDNKRKQSNQLISRGISNTSIKSKISETTIC